MIRNGGRRVGDAPAGAPMPRTVLVRGAGLAALAGAARTLPRRGAITRRR